MNTEDNLRKEITICICGKERKGMSSRGMKIEKYIKRLKELETKK